MDIETEKFGDKIDKDTTWKVVISNEKTKEEAIIYRHCRGGIFIVAQGQPEEAVPIGGTRQGVFGELAYIMVAYFKSKTMIRETLKKHLGKKFEELEKLDPYKNL